MNLPWWAVLIVLGLEAWLGKTSKTQSGSILEMIVLVLKRFTQPKT